MQQTQTQIGATRPTNKQSNQTHGEQLEALSSQRGLCCRAKEEAELAQAGMDAAAAAQYQALLAAQEEERQAALQAMYAKSATRAAQAGQQACRWMVMSMLCW